MKIKLLVIDDSAFMRSAVRLMLQDDPEIEIVGAASDGLSAIKMVEALDPDVITMDVEMPGMDGVTATRSIMEKFPRPIIMLSSQTELGNETTIKALEAGAVDFIPKKSAFVQLDIAQIGTELHKKIRYWGERHLQVKNNKQKTSTTETPTIPLNWSGAYQPELVIIGVSTGGPAIMSRLLSRIGTPTCPVVIAQHMPPSFTEGFAKHLKMETGLNVMHASDGMTLMPGMIVICPGGTDTTLRESVPGRLIVILKLNPTAPIHPSVDILFTSAARLTRRVAAVILTGMGSDGTVGTRALVDRGCPILVQEPGECTVDGMPTSVIESGVLHEELNIAGIGHRLNKWVGTIS